MVMNAEMYLKEYIDNHVSINRWKERNTFPAMLWDIYNFYEMIILGKSCILVEIRDGAPGIAAIEKHICRIEALTNLDVVLYYQSMSQYRRKILIEKRISFIIEGGQMFVPFLGMDLKKVTPSVGKSIKTFSASAQLTFLYLLYNKGVIVNATAFARKMGISAMTASRALNELYAVNLVTYKTGGKTGRSKEYTRISDPAYFVNGSLYVKNPVWRVVYVASVPEDALVAGLEALAEISMLNPPEHPIRAIGKDQFDVQKYVIIKNMDMIKDEKLTELQIWEYNPKQLSDKYYVDSVSLYASLKEEQDERIEQALEEVFRGKSWYTG